MNRTTNVIDEESAAIRRELHAHNEAQREQYRRRAVVEMARRAHQQGQAHLSIVRAA